MMVALRSLTDDSVVELRDVMLSEQRDRVRRRVCLVCGKTRGLCDCGEYEQTSDRRDFASDGGGE